MVPTRRSAKTQRKMIPPCSMFDMCSLKGLSKLLFEIFNLSLHPLRRSFRIELLCALVVLRRGAASTCTCQHASKAVISMRNHRVNSVMQTCHLRDKNSLKRALVET